jgi:hypothetical protein
MNTKKDQSEETMSFSLWALACRVILQKKGPRRSRSVQARMHPQSKGGSVAQVALPQSLIPRAAPIA